MTPRRLLVAEIVEILSAWTLQATQVRAPYLFAPRNTDIKNRPDPAYLPSSLLLLTHLSTSGTRPDPRSQPYLMGTLLALDAGVVPGQRGRRTCSARAQSRPLLCRSLSLGEAVYGVLDPFPSGLVPFSLNTYY